MFDFIPISIYTMLFYHLMMAATLLFSGVTLSNGLESIELKRISAILGGLGFLFVSLYIGSRQPSYAFGDTGNYNKFYQQMQQGIDVAIKNDYVFNYFMLVSAKFMSARMFFFLDALIYVVPMYLFSRKFCGSYWGIAFFMFAASYSFWPYGVNGIRNGMATSVFILGLVYYERKLVMYLLFLLSFGIHNSLMIPIAAFVASGLYKNPKLYFYIWLASIPMSLIGGGFWGTFFTSLGFGDERAESYLDANAITQLGKNENTTFSSTGFRWDFLIYSSTGVITGWYFLVKHKIKDVFYTHLWGVYVIANAFWILVIRAAFSNRFAYLSWFLMAPVIIYPFIKYKMPINNQGLFVAIILILYYGFTYFMFLKL